MSLDDAGQSSLSFTNLKKFSRKTIPFGKKMAHDDCEFEEEIYIREMNISYALSTGCALWDGSIIMSRLVRDQCGLFTGADILELGSGCGLLGIMCARYASSVIMTDWTEALVDNLKYNISLNANLELSPEDNPIEQLRRTHKMNVLKSASVEHFDYSDPNVDMKDSLDKNQFDIIIGSEIVYTNNAKQIAGLRHAVESLLKPDGVFYMIQSTDRRSRPLLLEAFQENFHVSINDIPEEYLGKYGTGQRYEIYELFTCTLKNKDQGNEETFDPFISVNNKLMPNKRYILGDKPRSFECIEPAPCDVPAPIEKKQVITRKKTRNEQRRSSTPDNLEKQIDDSCILRGLFGDSDTDDN